MKTRCLRGQAIPERLWNIDQPPKELFLVGELEALLHRPCLSVVGTRKPTAYGRQVTEMLVSELASHGVVIISGLAFGIDSIAHRACLSVGGRTIAVLPTSLESIYPVAHRQLAKQIFEHGGALVTEYPPGSSARKYNFVERNRLVSGLSDGVLVIEAAAASGTQHTATFALDQSRTLMAVPGNITSPLSTGTNKMIKTEAIAVTDASDILLALGLTGAAYNKEILAANASESSVITLLQQGITDGSQLQIGSKLSVSNFNQTLTMLEITGKIRPLGAGHWALN